MDRTVALDHAAVESAARADSSAGQSVSLTPRRSRVRPLLRPLRGTECPGAQGVWGMSVERRVFLPWCAAQGVDGVDALNQRVLDRFTSSLLTEGGTLGRPLSRFSVHSHARTVRQFLAWCQREGEEVRGQPQLPSLPRRVLDVLSRDEMDQLELAAPTERDKPIIRLLADSGIRAGELCGLRNSARSSRRASSVPASTRSATGTTVAPPRDSAARSGLPPAEGSSVLPDGRRSRRGCWSRYGQSVAYQGCRYTAHIDLQAGRSIVVALCPAPICSPNTCMTVLLARAGRRGRDRLGRGWRSPRRTTEQGGRSRTGAGDAPDDGGVWPRLIRTVRHARWPVTGRHCGPRDGSSTYPEPGPWSGVPPGHPLAPSQSPPNYHGTNLSSRWSVRGCPGEWTPSSAPWES
jgi:hypothetical protein